MALVGWDEEAEVVRRWNSGIVAIVAAALTAGCGGGESKQAAAAAEAAATEPASGSVTSVAPAPTTEQDWAQVVTALGRPGKLMDGGVYRVAFPRGDLKVRSEGVDVAPGLSLGSYAAFAKYPDGSSVVMGDLVVTESELPAVTDALQARGIEQTAVHKHLLTQTPAIWWTHFHAHGDATKIAEALRAVLGKTATPAAAPAPSSPPSAPPLELDTTGVDAALGRTGVADNGIYKFTIARAEPISDVGRILPPAMGVTTVVNFQPTGGGRAAINGDFAMLAGEVQSVLRALRSHGIHVVELHNHMLSDSPRLFYLHFWANDDAVQLARGLRTAVDATNTKPAP